MGAHENAPKWLGKYPITDPEHSDELEIRAAINEHHYRMPRHEAEAKAHSDYRRDQIITAAAHHRLGMNISHAAGKLDEAKKHATMYAFAMHQLGHKDLVTPPDEVADKMKKTPSEDLAKFKAHPADMFSMPELGDNEKPKARGSLEPDVKREAQNIRDKQLEAKK